MNKALLIVLIGAIGLVSCGDDGVVTPKPRMYPKINYPKGTYKSFESTECQFTFQMPTYADVKTDINFFGEKHVSDCWFDLNVKQLNSTIHFSYNRIDQENTLQKLVSDAFQLAEKHNVKAEYRDEVIIENKNGVKGLLFNIDGPVASPINFFLTDTTSHFVRASLYFNDAVNPDSIAPVLDFVSKDVDKILETFEWKD